MPNLETPLHSVPKCGHNYLPKNREKSSFLAVLGCFSTVFGNFEPSDGHLPPPKPPLTVISTPKRIKKRHCFVSRAPPKTGPLKTALFMVKFDHI